MLYALERVQVDNQYTWSTLKSTCTQSIEPPSRAREISCNAPPTNQFTIIDVRLYARYTQIFAKHGDFLIRRPIDGCVRFVLATGVGVGAVVGNCGGRHICVGVYE